VSEIPKNKGKTGTNILKNSMSGVLGNSQNLPTARHSHNKGNYMKEDILEQLADDFLQFRGYFTMHNVKFRPQADHPEFVSNQDSNNSDIDVIGINPKLAGCDRVWAISCKSWQGGFRPAARIAKISSNGRVSGRDAWKGFRELVMPKWAMAFRKAVFDLTGSNEFTYVTAVTKLHGDKSIWQDHQPFLDIIQAPIKVLTLNEMLEEVWPGLNTTPAASDVGRTLQLIKASGWSPAPRPTRRGG
jgi:hypothetical protein